MAISLFAPTPSHYSLCQRPRSPSFFNGRLTLNRYPAPKLIAFCATSTPVVDDGLPPPPDAISAQPQSTMEDGYEVPAGGCKACGREEIERGCNGEGRIQGGIATVPGFGWWPIKAYRPCPGFVASGGRYRRRGQSMDEVAFGRGKPRSSTSMNIDGDGEDR